MSCLAGPRGVVVTSLADDLRSTARQALLMRVADELDRLSARLARVVAERDSLAADLARVTAERDALRAELAAIEPDAFEDDPDGYDEALS